MFDVTQKDSFETVADYIRFYKSESETRIPGNVVLIGNKGDLISDR